MTSARFRLGKSSVGASGPWSWGSYDAPIDADPSDWIKVEFESLAGIDTMSCTVPAADELTMAAGVPTPTVDPATRTAVFQLHSTVGATYRVRATGNPGTAGAVFTELAVHVLTAGGYRLLSLDEEDQSSRTYYWLAKFNALVRAAGSGGGASLLEGATLRVDATNGDNGTAVRGDISKPYLTVSAALFAAQSGDTVEIGPGTWSDEHVIPQIARLRIKGAGITKTFLTWAGSDSYALSRSSNAAMESLEISDMALSCTGARSVALEFNGAAVTVNGLFVSTAYDSWLIGDGLYLNNIRLSSTGTDGVALKLQCLGFVEARGLQIEDGTTSILEVYQLRTYSCVFGSVTGGYDNDVSAAPNYDSSPLTSGLWESYSCRFGSITASTAKAWKWRFFGGHATGNITLATVYASTFHEFSTFYCDGTVSYSSAVTTGSLILANSLVGVLDVNKTGGAGAVGEVSNCQVGHVEADGAQVKMWGGWTDTALFVPLNSGNLSFYVAGTASPTVYS